MDDPLDAVIAAIAVRQNGNITRRQLLKLGLGDDAGGAAVYFPRDLKGRERCSTARPHSRPKAL